MWTLWLITLGSIIAQGGAPTVVTPLATYQSAADCQAAISQIWGGLRKTYGKHNTPTPGTFFCVPGTPLKK